jgi:hypothetical protein
MAEQFQARSAWFNTIARGYAGWLTCDPQFCQERDKALGENLRVVSLIPDAFADASGDALPKHASDFLVRWRLIGMAGPRLPIPMRPMLGGQFPLSIVKQLMAAGEIFNLPDTFPIPSRDELRELLDEAVRSERPDHLGEWMKITGKNNPAKNRIDRFSRVFELHHYWQLLQVRHQPYLRGRLTKLRFVLAQYLGASEDSIRADLGLIRRLGKKRRAE